MGAKVAQNIQADMLETTGYKDIAKSLSEMPEFKEFAKGDITEDEFSDLIVQPVENRKEETYQKKLKENTELLHQEISTSGKIEEIKKRLQKLHGLNIRENDIQTIQNEKIEQEKKAELQEKLSHLDEIIAKELLDFFENEETHGLDYFNAVGRDRRRLGYENIAAKVMNKLGVEIPEDGVLDDDNYFLFDDVEDKVIDLEREASGQTYIDEKTNQWVDNRWEFLEKKAGLETHQEEQLSPEESKKRLKEAKKEAKNSSNASFNDLSALAALKDKFNGRK